MIFDWFVPGFALVAMVVIIGLVIIYGPGRDGE